MKKYLFFILFITLAINLISNSYAYGFDLTYTDLSGNVINYSTYQGNYLFVEAMQAWCPHCQEQAPVLDGIHQTFPNLVMLSIDIDSSETVSSINSFNSQYGTTWLSGMDTNGVFASKFGITSTPVMILFDQNGNLLHQWNGYTDYAALKNGLSVYLGTGNPSYTYVEPSISNGPQTSLFGDIIGSPIFQGAFLLLVVVLLYTRLTKAPKDPSEPKTSSK